jgi:hypothetical protein
VERLTAIVRTPNGATVQEQVAFIPTRGTVPQLKSFFNLFGALDAVVSIPPELFSTRLSFSSGRRSKTCPTYPALMSDEPRKHHYVPVFYQKHSANSNGLLWVYDHLLKTHKELHPRSICCEKDLYASKPKDHPWDRRLESEYLSKIDNISTLAISRLASGARLVSTSQLLQNRSKLAPMPRRNRIWLSQIKPAS